MYSTRSVSEFHCDTVAGGDEQSCGAFFTHRFVDGLHVTELKAITFNISIGLSLMLPYKAQADCVIVETDMSRPVVAVFEVQPPVATRATAAMRAQRRQCSFPGATPHDIAQVQCIVNKQRSSRRRTQTKFTFQKSNAQQPQLFCYNAFVRFQLHNDATPSESSEIRNLRASWASEAAQFLRPDLVFQPHIHRNKEKVKTRCSPEKKTEQEGHRICHRLVRCLSLWPKIQRRRTLL
jgi:hypothetical protein